MERTKHFSKSCVIHHTVSFPERHPYLFSPVDAFFYLDLMGVCSIPLVKMMMFSYFVDFWSMGRVFPLWVLSSLSFYKYEVFVFPDLLQIVHLICTWNQMDNGLYFIRTSVFTVLCPGVHKKVNIVIMHHR